MNIKNNTNTNSTYIKSQESTKKIINQRICTMLSDVSENNKLFPEHKSLLIGLLSEQSQICGESKDIFVNYDKLIQNQEIFNNSYNMLQNQYFLLKIN